MSTIPVKENQDVYFSSFRELEKRARSQGGAWFHATRQAALDRFAELGFPTVQQEAWRFTNVAPIASTRFELAWGGAAPDIIKKLERSAFWDLECSRLVFVNGRFVPELSPVDSLPQGVKAGSLAPALSNGAGTVKEHLAAHARYEDHPFVALNTAFVEDGAFVEVAKGTVLDRPLYLLYVSTAAGRPTVSHPRNLVLLGRESQATIIEAHVGLGDGVYFTNGVTEVVAGEGAVADYIKIQLESQRAYNVSTLQIHQSRNSNVSTYAISMGAALSRQEARSVLDGEGAECFLNGLYQVTGRQHIDNYTTLDHAKPHCNSRELYKGILDGNASGVFHGRIIVRKDAQKTDAKQSNKNLLLSDNAVINTKPQLEIYADDVKCTHGATIGQIDADAVFYLRSRGIGLDEARTMLTYAFANEIISRLKFEPLRARLRESLLERLPKS